MEFFELKCFCVEVVTYMCPNEGCWLEKIATPQEKDTPPHGGFELLNCG